MVVFEPSYFLSEPTNDRSQNTPTSEKLHFGGGGTNLRKLILHTVSHSQLISRVFLERILMLLWLDLLEIVEVCGLSEGRGGIKLLAFTTLVFLFP